MRELHRSSASGPLTTGPSPSGAASTLFRAVVKDDRAGAPGGQFCLVLAWLSGKTNPEPFKSSPYAPLGRTPRDRTTRLGDLHVSSPSSVPSLPFQSHTSHLGLSAPYQSLETVLLYCQFFFFSFHFFFFFF